MGKLLLQGHKIYISQEVAFKWEDPLVQHKDIQLKIRNTSTVAQQWDQRNNSWNVQRNSKFTNNNVQIWK